MASLQVLAVGKNKLAAGAAWDPCSLKAAAEAEDGNDVSRPGEVSFLSVGKAAWVDGGIARAGAV